MTQRFPALMCLAALISFAVVAGVSQAGAQGSFIRGDANADSELTIADPLTIFTRLFYGGPPLPGPEDAADANDNGVVEIADSAYLLVMLIWGGPPPPPPYPNPGVDTTPPTFPTAPAAGLEFRLALSSGCLGSQSIVRMLISNTEPLQGFSSRIEFDPSLLAWQSADSLPLEAIIGGAPELFTCEEISPGVLNMGVMPSVGDPSGGAIPAGSEQWILDLAFLISASAPPSTLLAVDFADDPAASPPLYNVASIDGQAFTPLSTGGGIVTDCAPEEFLRGDSNEDGAVSISDAVFIIDQLFLSGPPSSCERTADTNGDGARDIADVIFLLDALFFGGVTIPAPYPGCGADPIPSSLTCVSYPGGCP
ncbi:MAG: dockerin type I domain-containing protein [Planctomycetota bacterium]